MATMIGRSAMCVTCVARNSWRIHAIGAASASMSQPHRSFSGKLTLQLANYDLNQTTIILATVAKVDYMKLSQQRLDAQPGQKPAAVDRKPDAGQIEAIYLHLSDTVINGN